MKLHRFILVAMLAACLATPSALAADRVRIVTLVLPLKYFAEQVGGSRVTVSALVERGQDPHTFELRPGQMAALAEADGYFSVGMPFEEHLVPRARELNRGLRFFPCDAGVDKILPGEDRHGEEEKHHHDDHRHHRGADPHIWNAPREAKVIAENIARGLTELDPGGADHYASNLAAFTSRLDALDGEFRALFRGKEGMSFLVFHPAWGYLAREYGLVEVPIEVDGKEPKAADMADVVRKGKAKGVQVILIAPQFSRQSAETVAGAIGASVHVANPLAEDWEENLRQVANAIAEAAK